MSKKWKFNKLITEGQGKELIQIGTNHSDPYKKHNLGERDDSVLFLFCALFLSFTTHSKGIRDKDPDLTKNLTWNKRGHLQPNKFFDSM